MYFVFCRQLRTKQPTHIHINLCVSLLGFYIAFLSSSFAVSNPIACAAVSATIHFFCLTTVAWMSAEALNMYYLFVKVERTSIRWFIPAACLFGYGVFIFLQSLLPKWVIINPVDYMSDSFILDN